VGNALRGSLDCLADIVDRWPRGKRPRAPREGDGGRVDGRERGGVPGSENWMCEDMRQMATKQDGTYDID
jgi:hypothetical protein